MQGNEFFKYMVLIESVKFVNIYSFLSIFSSFQCFHVFRFECDIVLSSSFDRSDKRGYKLMIHVMSPERYFYTSKLCLIGSIVGTKSANFDALGF